jgi:hypothetical protein
VDEQLLVSQEGIISMELVLNETTAGFRVSEGCLGTLLF